MQKSIIGILIAILGCTTRQPNKGSDAPENQRSEPQPVGRPEPLVIGSNRGVCDSPGGPMPDAATLGHWYANDMRAHIKTFGLIPPDSSSVVLEPDAAINKRADKELDSQFAKWGSTSTSSKAKERKPTSPDAKVALLLYKARSIYALVDPGQQFCGGDIRALPIVFFFDTKWRYLGSRSK
jgi:hypothetical protein